MRGHDVEDERDREDHHEGGAADLDESAGLAVGGLHVKSRGTFRFVGHRFADPSVLGLSASQSRSLMAPLGYRRPRGESDPAQVSPQGRNQIAGRGERCRRRAETDWRNHASANPSTAGLPASRRPAAPPRSSRLRRATGRTRDRDQRGRQPGQRLGQQRRHPRIRRLDTGTPQVLRLEPVDIALGQQKAVGRTGSATGSAR